MNAVEQVFRVFFNFIMTMTIWDIIDIAIMSFIIYKLLSFVRRTSSAGVIKGIILLLAVMWLSSVLHLHVLNYLLGKTMELGVVVLIVIFQPEIRKFLSQIGSRRIIEFFSRKPNERMIETAISHTVAACSDMARTKTGALIAFQRDISLEEYTKTGTPMDAEPSAELLKNVFFPNTPLHDGAVIIEDGRIQAAGCMLPMSSNVNLSRDLGMRHRAGIGLSERTDAVVVIVSEETGAISVAIDGMLKRHLTAETFEKLLRNELLPENKKTVSSSILDKIRVKQ